ncbi:MAG: MBL fold metallo-hydrolase [Deltaproteobacteria bacterium]|nr:MBL fold metallo-hydrolase [Deltaproteobacteria bacterium]
MTVGPLKVNCYILGDEQSGQAIVIDPGGDAEKIATFLDQKGLTLQTIINTHGHWDHTSGNAELKKLAGGEILMHASEDPMGVSIDGHLAEGDQVTVGRLVLEVMETPGHSPGGISLYLAEADVVFVGDLIFSRAIGRTDMPGSNRDTLLKSIQERIYPLPGQTMIAPGHGSMTALDWEKMSNPYLKRFRPLPGQEAEPKRDPWRD